MTQKNDIDLSEMQKSIQAIEERCEILQTLQQKEEEAHRKLMEQRRQLLEDRKRRHEEEKMLKEEEEEMMMKTKKPKRNPRVRQFNVYRYTVGI